VLFVARSRQVYIYWLWNHCLLLSFYLKDEQILIDIGNMIVGSSYLFHHNQLVLPSRTVPVQLSVRVYEPANRNRTAAYSQHFSSLHPDISFPLGLIIIRSVPFLCAPLFFSWLHHHHSDEKPQLKSCLFEPNLTDIRETERKTALRDKKKYHDKAKTNQNSALNCYFL